MKQQYEKPNADIVFLNSVDIASVSSGEQQNYPLVGCGEIVNG